MTAPMHELRAFEIFGEVPAGCFLHVLRDDRHAPHLRAGEIAVIDPADTDPLVSGELYLIQRGRDRLRDVMQVVRKIRHGVDGIWFRPLAGLRIADLDRVPLGRVYLSDGPLNPVYLPEYLIGRVVGIYQASAERAPPRPVTVPTLPAHTGALCRRTAAPPPPSRANHQGRAPMPTACRPTERTCAAALSVLNSAFSGPSPLTVAVARYHEAMETARPAGACAEVRGETALAAEQVFYANALGARPWSSLRDGMAVVAWLRGEFAAAATLQSQVDGVPSREAFASRALAEVHGLLSRLDDAGRVLVAELHRERNAPANAEHSDAAPDTVAAFNTASAAMCLPEAPTRAMVEAGAAAAGSTPEQVQAIYAAMADAYQRERAA